MTTTSTLTKNQKRDIRKDLFIKGHPVTLIARVRHDDSCGNGHNSFSITCDMYESGHQRGEPTVKHSSGKTLWLSSCGCLHDLVSKHFPELAGLLRWHLTSADSPMHYTANALYWAGHSGWCDGKPSSPPNWDHFASTAILGALEDDLSIDEWKAMDKEQMREALNARLPRLLEAFQRDVEAFGFTF